MADGPQPSLEDSPSGVNIPCSTSRIHFSYNLLAAFLLVPSVADISERHAARGGIGVENPDVEVGISLAFVPKVLGPNI